MCAHCTNIFAEPVLPKLKANIPLLRAKQLSCSKPQALNPVSCLQTAKLSGSGGRGGSGGSGRLLPEAGLLVMSWLQQPQHMIQHVQRLQFSDFSACRHKSQWLLHAEAS